MTPTAPPKTRSIMTIGYWRDALLVAILSVVILSAGSTILIPLVFALLLVVLLVAVSDTIVNLPISAIRCPTWLANVIAIILVLIGLFAIVFVIARQAGAVAEAIPNYEIRLDSLLTQMASAVGQDNALIVEEQLANLDMSVLLINAFEEARAFLNGFILMFLFLPFLFLERRVIWTKVNLIVPSEPLGTGAHELAKDISTGVRRYVGIKTFVSLLTGLVSYSVMKPMGVDFAETWAVLAFALNFIPSIGSVISVILPALIALFQFETLTPFLVIVFGCGIVQFAIGNILEPALTGRSLNLSPFMVILALTFWTSLWGIPGALLSVPISVCLLIVFSHLPATRPLAILMSGDGKLMNG